MIDLKPWQNIAPEWQAQRKANWPLIEKYLKYRNEDFTDFHEDYYLNIAKAYYFGDDIGLLPIKERRAQGKSFLYWDVRLVLHPKPTVENIKIVLDDWQEKGYTIPFATSYQFPIETWQYYLENNFAPASLCSNYMQVVFGETFEDTLRINQLTAEEHGAEMFVNLFFNMRSSICDETGYAGTIDRWVKLYFSAIPYIDDRQFLANHFNTKRIFKFLKRYEHNADYITEERLKTVQFIRKTMMTNRGQYCSEIQKGIDDMQQYFVDNNIALD